MASLPLFKVGALLIRTLAKPVSKSLRGSAINHPIVSTSLAKVGQASHQVTARLSVWSKGYSVRSLGSLPQDEAMERGADIFAESVVVGVAVSVLVVEYQLQASRAEVKRRRELEALEEKDVEMATEIRVLEER